MKAGQARHADGVRGAVRGRAVELRPLERVQRQLRRRLAEPARRLRRRRRQESSGREVRRHRGRDEEGVRHGDLPGMEDRRLDFCEFFKVYSGILHQLV